MSLVFNNTTDGNGIIQALERETGGNPGDISNSTINMQRATADINSAFSDYLALALQAGGTWQFDDSNQTDYPIIRTNIISGQRDYTFGTDGSNNLILDIYKAAILPSATATQYEEITPVDTQSDPSAATDFNNSSNTGTPREYDKTANGIIFRTVPNYNATNGLLLYINREATFFTPSDNTKKPGVPGLHHRWFVVRPAEDDARRNNRPTYPLLRAERLQMEKDIQAYFGRRERDVRHRLTTKGISFR